MSSQSQRSQRGTSERNPSLTSRLTSFFCCTPNLSSQHAADLEMQPLPIHERNGSQLLQAQHTHSSYPSQTRDIAASAGSSHSPTTQRPHHQIPERGIHDVHADVPTTAFALSPSTSSTEPRTQCWCTDCISQRSQFVRDQQSQVHQRDLERQRSQTRNASHSRRYEQRNQREQQQFQPAPETVTGPVPDSPRSIASEDFFNGRVNRVGAARIPARPSRTYGGGWFDA